MPSFIVDQQAEVLNSFRHIDPMKKNTLTRDLENIKISVISDKAINFMNSCIPIMIIDDDKEEVEAFMSLEEALDLYLMIPFNPIDTQQR